MIVKKLFCKVKCDMWDKDKKEFLFITTTYYIGWFLFGRIPIYSMEIDQRIENRLGEKPEEHQCAYYKEYGHLLRKESVK